MSLDFYLEAETCRACNREGERFFSGNYTHNVTPMWDKAGVYEALYKSEGKRAEEIVADLQRGFDHMVANPEEYKPLNPENGWGSYGSAVPWLRSVLDACQKHPRAIIRVSA